MSEETVTAADDRATMSASARRAALTDELRARHLAYRRSVEHLVDQAQQLLVELQATASLPEGMSRTFVLGPRYAAVREAHGTFEAARMALSQADARNRDNA